MFTRQNMLHIFNEKYKHFEIIRIWVKIVLLPINATNYNYDVKLVMHPLYNKFAITLVLSKYINLIFTP